MSDTKNRLYNILCIHRATALTLSRSKGLRDIQTCSSRAERKSWKCSHVQKITREGFCSRPPSWSTEHHHLTHHLHTRNKRNVYFFKIYDCLQGSCGRYWKTTMVSSLGSYKNLPLRCKAHEADKLMSVSQVRRSRLNLQKSCREEF